MSILIVDDQQIVRKGMRKMIEQMDAAFGEIFEAGDGEEALAAALDKKPDIMLVDVMMPGRNGLEFIEALRAAGGRAHIIIVSAYNDFKYTQEAIRNRVDDYLLKPVSKKELRDVLTLARRSVDRERDETSLSAEKETGYLHALLYGYLTGSDIYVNIEKLFAGFPGNADGQPYKIGLVRVGAGDTAAAFRAGADALLAAAGRPFLSFAADGGKLVYIACSTGEESHLETALSSRLQAAEGAGCGVSAGLPGLKSLRELYRQAEEALKESLFRGLPLCRYGGADRAPGQLLSRLELDRWLDLLLHGRAGELDGLIDRLFLRIAQLNPGPHAIETAMNDIVSYFSIGVADRYPAIREASGNTGAFEEAHSLFGYKAALKQTIGAMQRRVLQACGRESQNRIVDRVKKYVKANYHRDISLARVANELSMNYSYISSVFTAVEGITFSEYVTRVRMEKARELLADGREKIYVVADKSGYPNPKYFCRLFKKRFDMSPVQYREKHFDN